MIFVVEKKSCFDFKQLPINKEINKTADSVASVLGAENPKVSGRCCKAQQHYYHKRLLEDATASSLCLLQNFNYVKRLGFIFLD